MRNKGITLVALVITIIIMLILAGVTLNIALGENRLFKMTKSAVDKYQESAQNEEKDLDGIVEDLKHIIPEDAGKEVEIPKAEKDKWDLAKVTPTADGKGNTIPVPKGFYYAGGNIDTGFVISDVSGDDLNNSKKGNQFVWIPCTATQYTDAIDDVIEKGWPAINEYRDNGDDIYTGTDGKGTGADWSDNYTDEDNKFIDRTYKNEDGTLTLPTDRWIKNQTTIASASLEKYEGFYIARFEAGIPRGTPFYRTLESGDLQYDTSRGSVEDTSKIESYRPVSQKGVQVWNCITQPNAKMLSENMYNNHANVGSYLVDSGSWNTICNMLSNILGASNNQRIINDSTIWGNYPDNIATDYTKIIGLWANQGTSMSGQVVAAQYKNTSITREDRIEGASFIELPTGASDDFKLYNIYDLAGNAWEWTTTHNLKTKNNKEYMYVIPRGGGYNVSGKINPVVRANGQDDFIASNVFVGFRVVLYIK